MHSTRSHNLSVMFVLQYFGLGLIYPGMSLYLQDCLHFTGIQTGMVLAMASAAAFVFPVFGAVIADRLMPKERLLALCHLVAAALLVLFAFQTTYHAVLIVFLAYSLVFGPTSALVNAIAFHHMPEARHRFGSVRVWGTIGWILAACAFGFGWLGMGAPHIERLRDAFFLSAAVSLVLAVYVWICHPPAPMQGGKSLIPWDAVRVLADRRVLAMALVLFLASFFIRFFYTGAAPFLKQCGVAPALILPLMSLGQVTEIVAMLCLGSMIARLGYRTVFLMGASFALLQAIIFAAHAPWPLLIAGIMCHGLIYTLVNVTVLMYVDQFCHGDVRAAVHQKLALVSGGCATLAGSIVSGWALDWSMANGSVNYPLFWLVAAGVAALLLVVIALCVPAR